MDWITLEGVPPYDGRYPFDLEQRGFTTLEWGWLKRLAGYLPLTIQDGWKGGDPELFCVFAVIALYRAGKIADTDAADVFGSISRAPFDTAIQLETDTVPEEEDQDPPTSESSSSNGGSSGEGSRTSSATSAIIPPPTGIPASATSASAPTTSRR